MEVRCAGIVRKIIYVVLVIGAADHPAISRIGSIVGTQP
jgi:hypothetical protein